MSVPCCSEWARSVGWLIFGTAIVLLLWMVRYEFMLTERQVPIRYDRLTGHVELLNDDQRWELLPNPNTWLRSAGPERR